MSGTFLGGEQSIDLGVFLVFTAALGLVGDHRLVVEVDRDVQDAPT